MLFLSLTTLPFSTLISLNLTRNSIIISFAASGMDMISLEGKTNFFEKRVGEYQKSGVMASLEGKNSDSGAGVVVKELDFGADF